MGVFSSDYGIAELKASPQYTGSVQKRNPQITQMERGESKNFNTGMQKWSVLKVFSNGYIRTLIEWQVAREKQEIQEQWQQILGLQNLLTATNDQLHVNTQINHHEQPNG